MAIRSGSPLIPPFGWSEKGAAVIEGIYAA